MPNHFAYIALFSWPAVVFWLFRAMPRTEALIWSIIGGYLLLPSGVGINPPVLPTFDKTFIPAASAALMCLISPENRHSRRHKRLVASRESVVELQTENTFTSIHARQFSNAYRSEQSGSVGLDGLNSTRQRIWIVDLLLVALFAAPLITVIQNSEPVRVGAVRVLPGLKLYDYFSMVLTQLVAVLPFFLGRRYLSNENGQASLLNILALAGLFYSLPTLFEIRMSPQLSHWVYGFLDRPFAMSMRDGGFRPIVFLHAGLWLAIFTTMVTLSALSFWRNERAAGRKSLWLLAGLYMSVVMALSHSLGALLILIALAPVVLFGSVRLQLITSSIVAASIMTYPMLRGANIVPVEAVYQFVKSTISSERADSFSFRLKNEDQLLARANQKPLAGWGGYGRGRVYNSYGRDVSVTDGIWVIVIGDSGWLGYIVVFGLLTAPILLLSLRRREIAPSLATSGLCLVLSANLIDMIPNATLTPVTWFIAGALAGRLSCSASTQKPEGAPGQVRKSPPARVDRKYAVVGARGKFPRRSGN